MTRNMTISTKQQKNQKEKLKLQIHFNPTLNENLKHDLIQYDKLLSPTYIGK